MPTPSKKSKRNDPSYGRVGSNRYPVERTFGVVAPATTEILVDVAKCLSAINRRLYRQGRVYHVRIDLQTPAADGVGANIKRIPNTWMVKKAWELAKAERDEQLSKSKRPRGRWDDFRVGWDATYKTGLAPSLADFSGTYTIDESNVSKAHDSTTSDDHEFVMFGAARDASTNLYGILEQYDLTGNVLDNQPAGQLTTGAYVDLQPDSGLAESAGDLAALQGDNPPYDANGIVGADDKGSVMIPSLSQSSSGNGSARNHLFTELPLGLLKIENATNSGIAYIFTVMAGDYKGVKALDW